MSLRRILTCLILCWSALRKSWAYRQGDPVDTDVQTDGLLWDPARSQMPRFGIKTKVYFDMQSPDDERVYRTFSLLFEDGLRSIETRPYQNRHKEYLDRIVVKFIYSKSGTGMIHSVSSTAVYRSHPVAAHRFRVEYEWQEEEAVRLTVGAIVMLLAVFLSSIVFLFQTCGLMGGDSEMNTMDDLSSYSDHKKW